jgi:MFS family permease
MTSKDRVTAWTDDALIKPGPAADGAEVAGHSLTVAVVIAGLLAGGTPALALPVLGRIAEQLEVGSSTATWVVTSSLLSSAVLTPVLGRVGDLRGRRRVLLVTLSMVMIGSVIAATTTDFGILLIGRVLQGASGALFPLGISTLRDHLHGRRRATATAVLSGALGVGGGGAIVVSGVLGGGSDYRPIFWFAVGLAAVAIAAVLIGVPRDRAAVHRGRVDLIGCALLTVGLLASLLPLSQGTQWGFGSALALSLWGAAVIALAALAVVEGRLAQPLIPRQLLRHRQVIVTNLIGFLIGGMIFIPLVVIPLMVEATPSIVGGGRGATPLEASLTYLLPGSLAAMIGAPIGGRLTARSGGRRALTLGGLVAGAGFAVMLVLPTHSTALIGGFILLSVAVTITYAAMPDLLDRAVAHDDIGVANGINALGRWIGAAVFTAVAAAILATAGQTPPSESAIRIMFAIGLAIALGISAGAIVGLSAVPGGVVRVITPSSFAVRSRGSAG